MIFSLGWNPTCTGGVPVNFLKHDMDTNDFSTVCNHHFTVIFHEKSSKTFNRYLVSVVDLVSKSVSDYVIK